MQAAHELRVEKILPAYRPEALQSMIAYRQDRADRRATAKRFEHSVASDHESVGGAVEAPRIEAVQHGSELETETRRVELLTIRDRDRNALDVLVRKRPGDRS